LKTPKIAKWSAFTCAAVVSFGYPAHAQSGSSGSADAPVSLRQLLERLPVDPNGLTADRVAETVLRESPDLKAKMEDVVAASAAVDQARVAFIPKLTASGLLGKASPIQSSDFGNLVVAPGAPPGPLAPGTPLANEPITFPPAPTHRYAVQASLDIPLSDYLLRTRQALSSAQNNKASTEVTRQAAVLSTASEARVLFYNWVRAQLQTIVAEQALRQSKDHLQDVQNAFAAETASRADVLASESQEAKSELTLQRAQDLTAFAEQQLRIVMHETAVRGYRVGVSVLTADIGDRWGEDLSILQREAIEARLEPRALERTSDSLKDQARAANAGIFPRLDGIASVNYANPNTTIYPLKDGFVTTWLVGLQATWEINGIPDAIAARRGLEARAAEAQARRRGAEDSVLTEVAQNWQALIDARAAVQWSRRSAIAAEEAYRVRRELFQNGRASYVELTDAETDLTSSRFSVVDAEIDLRIATIRLAHATGRDLHGGSANR